MRTGWNVSWLSSTFQSCMLARVNQRQFKDCRSPLCDIAKPSHHQRKRRSSNPCNVPCSMHDPSSAQPFPVSTTHPTYQSTVKPYTADCATMPDNACPRAVSAHP
jgi:hypothetical protein